MTASNILVVDTDPRTTQLVSALFPSDVCVVQHAADAVEAVDIARAQLPVLAIICADIESGYGCCRQFKKDNDLKAIPVVLVSAHATPEQFSDHQKLPTSADTYLHKPLDESLLASVVIDLLGSARSRRAAAGENAQQTPPEDVNFSADIDPEVPVSDENDTHRPDGSEQPTSSPEPTDSSDSLQGEEDSSVGAIDDSTPTASVPHGAPVSESPYTMPTAALVQVDALTHERDALLSQNEDLKQANQRAQQFFEIEQQRLLSQIATLKARCEALEEKIRQHSVDELTDKIEAQQDQIVSLRAEIQQLKSVRRNLEHTLTDALATVAKLPQDN